MSPGATNASISLQRIWVRTPPALRCSATCRLSRCARAVCLEGQSQTSLSVLPPLLEPYTQPKRHCTALSLSSFHALGPPPPTRAGRVLVFSHEPRGVSSDPVATHHNFPVQLYNPKTAAVAARSASLGCSAAAPFVGHVTNHHYCTRESAKLNCGNFSAGVARVHVLTLKMTLFSRLSCLISRES